MLKGRCKSCFDSQTKASAASTPLGDRLVEAVSGSLVFLEMVPEMPALSSESPSIKRYFGILTAQSDSAWLKDRRRKVLHRKM